VPGLLRRAQGANQMSELGNVLGFQVRTAETKDHFRQLIDALTEHDSVVLIVAHRTEDGETSWVTLHRAAHLYEAIGMVEYARDQMRDERGVP
jgi:hypothetical protein